MIDYWCNAFTPDRAPLWAAVIEEQGLGIRTRAGAADDDFASAAVMVERMDRLGIEALVLPVCDVAADAALDDFGRYAVRPGEIADFVVSHPHRFFGVYSVDPTGGHADVARAAAALDEDWCIGLHTHTHSWERGFDHPDYVAYYGLCVEHGVPFTMQAGRSGGNFVHESGHPAAIAEPARNFPTVPFVLSHTGAPWVEQAIAAATEFDNVVIGTATHPPRRWPPVLLDFIRGRGRERTLFGTGFPVTGHSRSLAQFGDLDLDHDIREAVLGGNARRIFTRIPDRPGA